MPSEFAMYFAFPKYFDSDTANSRIEKIRDIPKLIGSYSFKLLLIVLFLVIYAPVWAQSIPIQLEQSVDIVAARQKSLAVEATAFAREKSEFSAWRSEFSARAAELVSRTLAQSDVEQAGLAVEARKVALESLGLDILTAEQNRKEIEKLVQQLGDQLQTLAADPAQGTADKITKTKATLAEQRSLLALELQNIEQLALRNGLIKERLALAEQWHTVVREAYQRQQEKARQQTAEEIEKQLATERQQWQEAVEKLRSQLAQFREEPYASQAKRDLIEVQLLEAEESIFLIGVRQKLAQIRIQLEKITTDMFEFISEPQLMKTTSSDLSQFKSQLETLGRLLKSKHTLIQQRMEVATKSQSLATDNQGIYDEVHSTHRRVMTSFEQLISEQSSLSLKIQDSVNLIGSEYLAQKKKDLTLRHRLPASAEEWQTLLIELNRLPLTLLQAGRNILLALQSAMEQAGLGTWSLLTFLGLVWSLVCLSLGYLTRPGRFVATGSFTQKTLLVSTAIVHASRYGLLVAGLVILAAWILDIIPPGLALISILAGIWLGARTIIGLSWWILKSPAGMRDKQPGLYRFIVFFVILSSLLGVALALAHLGFLSSSLRELVDRAFSLLLLPPAYLALRIRTLLMEVLKERKGSVYWVRLLGLAGFVIPLAMFAAALLGIAGYINLAWGTAGYLSLIIVVVAIWLVARGLVIDLTRTIEALLARKSERSTFWMRSLVEPLHYLVRLGLFLLAVWILYYLFGGDPTTGSYLKTWLSHPLFTIGETTINSFNLLGSLLLLLLVLYFGHWAREITYGWIYGGIQDLGIRNSLSVFTQYAVVVVGLIIAMNILGINLTSLTVFAGALGVGIGFGLQNIANNFISGLILLAERPVRTKDWVTIGSNEGEISQIGMRSVTVTTWDNQDVIIPNSDLISNAFVNWTRTNSVVRTVLIIGIRYQDDPHAAKKVIEDAVVLQPEVLLDPAPRVWLTEFGASSVNLRVHYHIDVLAFSRLEVKSKVMFAIWDALKEADIGIPFPQQDIYIKELPGDHKGITESLVPKLVE